MTVACERRQFALLTDLAFGELQQDLEELLAFNAYAAAPMSQPNYYQTLSAYFTYRNEFKRGGQRSRTPSPATHALRLPSGRGALPVRAPLDHDH